MLTSTWRMIFPLLFSILSTFFTFNGLSSFLILKPCLLAISLSMNIPVTPLSKSTFTVIPLCVSTFFILMSSHTSLKILNILLMSLFFSFSFAMLSGSSDHVPFCYPLASLGCATPFSFLFWHSCYDLAKQLS